MAKYTTILWDLDQTLLNFDLSMEHALRAVFDRYGLPIDEEIAARYDVINRSYRSEEHTSELQSQR